MPEVASWVFGSGVGAVAKPTRAQLLTPRIHFGGQSVTLPELGTIRWFDAALQSLTAPDRQTVYAMKRAAGDTMVMLALWWAYRSGDGYNYPVRDGLGIDFSEDWAGYKALIREAIANGFYVELKLACEGQRVVPGQLGWRWAMDYVPDLMLSLADVLPWCVTSLGFELFGPGGDWTDEQVTDAHFMLRRAVGNNVVALEFGQGYNKWDAGQRDPDDGAACWASPAGQAVDIFQQEFPQPIHWRDHWQGCEILSRRNLGPAYTGASDPTDPQPPWYFQTGTPRGPHQAWGYEYALYDWVRGQISAADYNGYRAELAALGYHVVG